jgi:hypothetical protein
MGAGPVGGSVVYSEDRVGVTGRLWAWLAVPVVVQLVLCLTTPVAFWAAALGATGSVELFSLVLLHQCWETGIRVTTDEVRIGGCRRAERLAAKRRLPPAVIDPHYRLRNQFSVPIAAIGSARVLRRPEFAELPGKVVTPAMATYMIERFAPTRTSSRYVLTNRWTVATRHPEALRAALTQVGVPVTPSDPSGLLPASSS